MIKLSRLAVVIFVWGCLQTQPALACRYNVRETGFVDFGDRPYILYCYVNKDTPEDITSSFREISYAALAESNVKSEIIDISRIKKHPALRYLDLWSIKSFPSAVLISPEGQSMPVPVTKPDQPFKRTLWSALDSIISSPKRDEILQQAIETYGIVLLVEGTDHQENKKAKESASAAIERIAVQMGTMPKQIPRPPVLVVIESQSFNREKILLWSLGLNADQINKPCAAVIYGRARWIGPLLMGEKITENMLTNILYIIGADCECGLDRRLMHGIMLPVSWDEKMQAQAAKTLGFDPENPMVKMEMSRILRQGFDSSARIRDANSYPGITFGYQELVVEFAPAQKSEESSEDGEKTLPPKPASKKSASEPSALPSPASTESPSKPSALAESEPALQKSLYIIAGLTVLIIAAGLFIVRRAAR